jgi:hypothetical protein
MVCLFEAPSIGFAKSSLLLPISKVALYSEYDFGVMPEASKYAFMWSVTGLFGVVIGLQGHVIWS